jgi:cytochrome c oxidase subunit 2
MNVQQQEVDATRENIAMAVAGFVMAGAIIGAGIGGLAAGRELAPPPAAVPAVVAPAAVASQSTAAPLAITIKGDPSKPGVYAFSPGAITVRAGQKVTLAITNPGAAMHGIAIPEFGINTMIQPTANGQVSTAQVSFTPTKAGTYVAHCIVYCGPGHSQMILRITVL